MGKLESKVAVITGAASGIGEATSVLFAEEGAEVVAADRDEGRGSISSLRCDPSGGTGIGLHAEMTF